MYSYRKIKSNKEQKVEEYQNAINQNSTTQLEKEILALNSELVKLTIQITYLSYAGLANEVERSAYDLHIDMRNVQDEVMLPTTIKLKKDL